MSLIPLIAKTATRDELIRLLDDHDKALRKAQAARDELLAALEEISQHMLPGEFSAHEAPNFEHRYETVVEIARAAIAKHKAGKEG